MNAQLELAEKALARRPSRWLILAAVSLLVVGGLAWALRPAREASQQELAAKAELSRLGALVVLDAERIHVNSVNLATLRSPETFDRAIALLADLPHIHSLNADGTRFADDHAAVVAQLGTLQDLVVSNTAITDAGLEELHGLSQLKTLHAANTQITSAGMPALGRLESLQIVDISGTKVTGNLEPLGQLPELHWLVAQRLVLDAAAIAAIGRCPNLSRVSLRETTCPDDAIQGLIERRPSLTIDR